MAEQQDWRISFYERADGERPVEAFLNALDAPTRARFFWSIEQLRLRNTQAREPLVKHIEGRLWELRRESNTNIYRILYVLLPGRRIMLLHGFQKKTQKTPAREIATAMARLNDILHREGGEP